MSKLASGRQAANIYVKKMSWPIGDNMFVHSSNPFILHVNYFYEGAIRGDDEEPGCDEYFELSEVKVLSPVCLTNYTGLALNISPTLNMLDILSEHQYDVIVEALSKGADSEDNIWVEEL